MTIFAPKRPKYGEDPNFVPNSIIGEGVTFRGMIKGSNAIMISGLVFGDINVDGEVIITETGYVKGDITSTFAVISGIVEGNVNLSSYASLKSTASVTGDITCTALNIEDGAIFTGVSKMIVKNSSLAKKLKRINEQAAALENWAPQPAAELPAEAEYEEAEAADEADEIETAEDVSGGDSASFIEEGEDKESVFPFEAEISTDEGEKPNTYEEDESAESMSFEADTDDGTEEEEAGPQSPDEELEALLQKKEEEES